MKSAPFFLSLSVFSNNFLQFIFGKGSNGFASLLLMLQTVFTGFICELFHSFCEGNKGSIAY